MKFKSARASLAAALAVTLLMSVIPYASAGSAAGQTGQGTGSSRARRGKNGDQTAKSSASQDSAAADNDQTTNSTPETSKPATLRSSDSAAQNSTRSFSTLDNTAADPQQQREAPPFDRPPIGTQSQPKKEPPSTRSQRPSYSDNDRRQRSNSDTDPQSGSVDPDRSNRGGQPPVLQRPSDSRSGDNGGASGQRPPVLHRPSDAPRDQDDSGGRTERQQRGAGGRQQQGDDDVIKLESTLVNLPLLVSDRSGRYVPQLSARDFELFEDGVQQTIASFGSEEVPFNVALMLDVSPSVSGSIKDIQDAAIDFVRELRSQDRVMVVAFDRGIHYLTDFTNDRRQLEWAIRGTRTGSGTSVYDAVYETVDRKLRNIEGRKAMILFSDGEDTTSSRASYDDAVNLVAESDVLVYGLRYPGTGGGGGIRIDPWPRSPIPRLPIPLPFPWPPPRRRGHFNISGSSSAAGAAVQSWPRRRGHGGDFMSDITAAGGGPVYDAENIRDMSRVASRIADELRHVYVISYYPTNPLSNGGYRRVRVRVKGRDEIAVRHRPGYNARPNGNARPTI
ncbi:MAG TPA: VWA domain-containing protein [Blastocatellia bacterium]|nr:VWA domain-containing protein [Blastocatellia bacterium]